MSDMIAFACTVEGMCCSAEVVPIERAVRALPGIRDVVADAALARLSVTYEAAALTPDRIVAQVERLGFRVATPIADNRPLVSAASEPDEGPGRRATTASDTRHLILDPQHTILTRPRELSMALCGLLILAAWTGGFFSAPLFLPDGLYVLAALVGGAFVARSGWATLRTTRVLDINTLMTIAATGALLIGEYAEGAIVVFLFALGNVLESYTMERARRSIRALMRMAPATALVLRDGVERELPVAEIAVGELIVVRPGDRIALDGVVVAGCSAVDQAPITGESVPIEKLAGSEVFAGSINGEGALEARVTRPAQDSTLARIIHLVEEAQANKAPTQRFVDVFARYYTPAVLILAALIAVVPPLVAGGGWLGWLYRALVLLVIACPCALVISTPVSIVSAISAGARAGLLFKGGAALEAAGGLRAMAFDKTGTITNGRPVVTDVIVFENQEPTTLSTTPATGVQLRAGDDRRPANNGQQPECCSECATQPPSYSSQADDLLRLAAAVERRSAHPLARAIVAAAEERALLLPVAGDFQSRSGRGASATVEGRRTMIGNRAMFVGAPLPAPVEARLAALERAGSTAMLVGYDGAIRGLIAVADEARAESRSTLAALKRLGIAHIAMLTGDAVRVAEQVAERVGVDEARAGLLPDEKLAAMDELLARHGSVAMVGDGINDAPALARATVGVAMGAAGSHVALETADITLMADDLTRLPFAIGLSRATRRVIMQNVAFALIVKAIFLLATLLGAATLWMAVLADTGAALIVIGNGMRLLRYRGE